MNITDYIPSGKSNAITRRDLCLAVFGEYNLTIDREVRNAIRLSRRHNAILNDQSGNGYYQPTLADFQTACKCRKQETNRAKSIFWSRRGLDLWIKKASKEMGIGNA